MRIAAAEATAKIALRRFAIRIPSFGIPDRTLKR